MLNKCLNSGCILGEKFEIFIETNILSNKSHEEKLETY